MGGGVSRVFFSDRDDCYVHTEIYWGRGNGWAMGALVAAIQNGTHSCGAILCFAAPPTLGWRVSCGVGESVPAH